MYRYAQVDINDDIVNGAIIVRDPIPPESIRTLPNGKKAVRPYVVEGFEELFDDKIFMRQGPEWVVEDDRVIEKHTLVFRQNAVDAMCINIDIEAGNQRLRFKSPGEGQDGVYVLKREEAEDCLKKYSASNPPPPGTYIMLDNEIGITNTPAGVPATSTIEVAQSVVYTASLWKPIATVIEKQRLTAKKRIKAKATVEEAYAEYLLAMDWVDPLTLL